MAVAADQYGQAPSFPVPTVNLQTVDVYNEALLHRRADVDVLRLDALALPELDAR